MPAHPSTTSTSTCAMPSARTGGMPTCSDCTRRTPSRPPRPGGCGRSSSRPTPITRTTSRYSRWGRTPPGRRSSRWASTTSPGGWPAYEDFGQMYQRLKERDVPTRVVDHTVSIGAYFSDPDGNGLEVYYESPRSEWHRTSPSRSRAPRAASPDPGTRRCSNPSSPPPRHSRRRHRRRDNAAHRWRQRGRRSRFSRRASSAPGRRLWSTRSCGSGCSVRE